MGFKRLLDSQRPTQQSPQPDNWPTAKLSANQTMLMSLSIEPWSEKTFDYRVDLPWSVCM
jgi:hypothetical protein